MISGTGPDKPRILLIATSSDSLQLKDNTKMETGYWAEEVAEPIDIFKKAGFEVEVGTLGGGKPPADPTSLNPAVVTQAVADKYSTFIAGSPEINNPIDLNALTPEKQKGYAGIFIAGGHGVLSDLANSKKAAEIISNALRSTYQVIGSVCHGPASFVSLKLIGEQDLLRGVKMTGFSEAEEQAAGLKGRVPFELESSLRDMGVEYSRSQQLWASNTVSDSGARVVTGQNPGSSKAAASETVKMINELQ